MVNEAGNEVHVEVERTVEYFVHVKAITKEQIKALEWFCEEAHARHFSKLPNNGVDERVRIATDFIQHLGNELNQKILQEEVY